MKIVNVILAVMILGLAGTAIFFASQLHQKRYLIKARGDLMREHTGQFIAKLDELIATTHHANYTATGKNLHHTAVPSAVDRALNELRAQYDRFADYQKTCLDRLADMTEDLTIPTAFDRAKAKGETTINQASDALQSGGRALLARDQALIRHLVSVGSEFETPASEETFASVGDLTAMTTASNAISDNIMALWSRIGTYETTITRIAGMCEAPAPSYSGDYASAFTVIQDNLAKINPTITTLDENIVGANDKIKTVNQEIQDRDKQITALNVDVADREKKVQDLSNVLTLPAPVPPKWTEDDHAIVLGAIKGDVMNVNREWSFLVVNRGTNTKVVQPNTDNEVAAPVPGGTYNMIVSREEGAMPTYVGKVKISRVEEDYMVVNINIPSEKEKDGIKVGDKVFFTPEEIRNIVSEKQAASPEAAEEVVDFDE